MRNSIPRRGRGSWKITQGWALPCCDSPGKLKLQAEVDPSSWSSVAQNTHVLGFGGTNASGNRGPCLYLLWTLPSH